MLTVATIVVTAEPKAGACRGRAGVGQTDMGFIHDVMHTFGVCREWARPGPAALAVRSLFEALVRKPRATHCLAAGRRRHTCIGPAPPAVRLVVPHGKA